MKRSVVILAVIFIFILPILLTVFFFQTDISGLVFVLSMVLFIQIIIAISFHYLPLFVRPTWMAEKKKFEGAEEVEEESRHINHEKVLGEIPFLVISDDVYKVYVTSKKLIFEKMYSLYSQQSYIGLGFLISRLLINDLSYTNITKIKIKRVYESYQVNSDGTKTSRGESLSPYCLIIYGLTKGLIKKMKEKILIRGFLVPPSSYFGQKMSVGLSEIGVAREYAIEIGNLLTSVLKDKVLKAADLQVIKNGYADKKLWERTKQQERFLKRERAKVIIGGILLFILGVIMLILGFWPWIPPLVEPLWVLLGYSILFFSIGILIIFVAICIIFQKKFGKKG